MISNLNKATNQNFQLTFPKLPISSTIDDSDILTLNIYGSVLPSITLSNITMNWMGGNYDMAIPPITFEPWYVNFIVDSDFKNWYLLYKWLMHINNNKSHYDRAPENYWIDASLNLVDNFNVPVMNINIINLFPTMLGEITLNHREGETNLESSINFSYTRYEINYLKNE